MLKGIFAALASLALSIATGCSKSKEEKPAAQPAPTETATPDKETTPPPETAPAADVPHVEGDSHSPAEHGAAEKPVETPTSLAEAAAMIDAAHAELAAIVKDGDLSKAHVVADRLKAAGAALPDLAGKAGLPAGDVKALTLAGKKLGLLFGDMDEAGDAGKRDEAAKVFARYDEPVKTIKAKAAGK